MANHFIYKAGDLARDERILIERWLGRPLSNDETISVNAYRPHPAPIGEERERLRREIVTQARDIGSRVPDAPAVDVDALVDEAVSSIRGRRG
jgi:hypothetical protein